MSQRIHSTHTLRDNILLIVILIALFITLFLSCVFAGSVEGAIRQISLIIWALLLILSLILSFFLLRYLVSRSGSALDSFPITKICESAILSGVLLVILMNPILSTPTKLITAMVVAVSHLLYTGHTLTRALRSFTRESLLFLHVPSAGPLWDSILLLILIFFSVVAFIRPHIFVDVIRFLLLRAYWITMIAVLSNLLIISLFPFAGYLREKNSITARTQSRDTIYLFSSNIRNYYGQNVLNVASLPHDTIYHFRYRNKWLSDRFISNQATNPEESKIYSDNELRQLEGTRILIIAADTPGMPNDPDKFTFYPLRMGTVTYLNVDGPILHVYFRLGDYVDWKDSPDRTTSKITQYNEVLKRKLTTSSNEKLYPHQGSQAGKFEGKYCIFIPNDTLSDFSFRSDEDSGDAWYDLIRVLVKVRRADEETHQHTIFFRIAALQEAKPLFWVQKQVRILKSILLGQNLPTYRLETIDPIEISPIQTGYELMHSTDCFLEFDFFYPDDKVPPHFDNYRLKPIADKALFPFLPEEIAVNYRYDQYLLLLTTPTVTTDTVTRLKLQLRAPESTTPKTDQNSPAPPKIPDLEILLKVVYPRYRNFLAFLILFTAQIITVFKDFAPTIRLLNLLPDEVIESLSNYGALIGPIVTTLTLFFLFRNLPSRPKS